MKKIISLQFFKIIFFTIIVTSLKAQTITAKPIYKGAQSLEIKEMESGRIYFGYQNPEYTTIIDIVSFAVDSKLKAVQLIEKAISILGMEKTDREQHIKDSFLGVELIRYGFNQKSVYLSHGKDRGVILSLKACNKIKNALEIYEYRYHK